MDIIILTAILSFLFYFFNRKKSKGSIIILFVVLFVFSAFRASTEGIDLPRYVSSFQYGDMGLLSRNMEFGFVLLMNFFSKINNSSLFFTIVTSSLVLIPLLIFVKRESKNVYLSLLLFLILGFYTESYNIVRQSISMSFMVLSLSFFINKENYKGLILTVIACSIHYSAIFILPLYLLSIKHIYIKPNIALLLISISILIGLSQVLRIDSINSDFFDKYIFINSYREKTTQFFYRLNMFERGLPGFIFIYIPSSIFTIFCSYRDKNKSNFTQLLIIGTILQNLIYYFAVVDRLALYLLIFQIVVFTNIYEDNKKRLRVAFVLMLTYYCILFIFRYSMQNLSGVYPFEFV